MSSSYSLYTIPTAKPEGLGDDVITYHQERLPTEAETEPPKTEFKLQRTIDALQMDVYRAVHEYVARKAGRVQELRFVEFIAIATFPAYYHRPGNLLLLRVTRDVAQSAIRHLNANLPGFRAKMRKIDLDSIKPIISDLKGAWFKVEDSADVTSQAIFGPNIDHDERFARAASEGPMSFARFMIDFKGETFQIGLSSECNVVLYDDNLDEVLELELILHVKSTFVDVAADKV